MSGFDIYDIDGALTKSGYDMMVFNNKINGSRSKPI